MINALQLSLSLYNRMSVVQALITLNSYERYLEIGCDNNQTFSVVRCNTKVGVDPVKGGTHRMTSDAFFAQNTEQFDMVFIDGYHHHDQVFRDITNSLAVLKEGGMIAMHDCNPRGRERESQDRCGTAWRAFTMFRSRPDLDMIVCNFDHGVGLIRRGVNTDPVELVKSMDELTYDDLDVNRVSWLNLKEAREIAEWVLKAQTTSG